MTLDLWAGLRKDTSVWKKGLGANLDSVGTASVFLRPRESGLNLGLDKMGSFVPLLGVGIRSGAEFGDLTDCRPPD